MVSGKNLMAALHNGLMSQGVVHSCRNDEAMVTAREYLWRRVKSSRGPFFNRVSRPTVDGSLFCVSR